MTTIRNQSAEIEMLQKELKSARWSDTLNERSKKSEEAKAAESSKKVVSKKD